MQGGGSQSKFEKVKNELSKIEDKIKEFELRESKLKEVELKKIVVIAGINKMDDRIFTSICTEKELTDKNTLWRDKKFDACDEVKCEFWVSVKNTTRFICSKNKMGFTD